MERGGYLGGRRRLGWSAGQPPDNGHLTLLHFDNCTGRFQQLPDLFGLLHANTLLEKRRRVVDKHLNFPQTQSGDRTDHLHDVYICLLVANAGKYYGELGRLGAQTANVLFLNRTRLRCRTNSRLFRWPRHSCAYGFAECTCRPFRDDVRDLCPVARRENSHFCRNKLQLVLNRTYFIVWKIFYADAIANQFLVQEHQAPISRHKQTLATAISTLYRSLDALVIPENVGQLLDFSSGQNPTRVV